MHSPPLKQTVKRSLINSSSLLIHSSQLSHSNRGVLYLRAGNMAERDDWIKSITEAMFMAENVSAR